MIEDEKIYDDSYKRYRDTKILLGISGLCACGAIIGSILYNSASSTHQVYDAVYSRENTNDDNIISYNDLIKYCKVIEVNQKGENKVYLVQENQLLDEGKFKYSYVDIRNNTEVALSDLNNSEDNKIVNVEDDITPYLITLKLVKSYYNEQDINSIYNGIVDLYQYSKDYQKNLS